MKVKTITLADNNYARAITIASQVIGDGGIVAFPTETFYGLGVRYDNSDGLKRLYHIKQRPEEKAMPLIIGRKELVSSVALPPGRLAEILIDRFWPGPLTLLFTALEGLSGFITSNTGRVALRMPGESFGLSLAMALPFPITATSANISGFPPADNAGDVAGHFGDAVNLVIDGGRTPGGRPSTIVDTAGDELNIVREGVITEKEIREYLSDRKYQ